MVQALRQMVKVKAGGRIEIPASELKEGDEAEVIVLVAKLKEPAAERLPIQEAIAKVQAIVRRHVAEDDSLSEEFIRERRLDSERE
jgi:hypothetical protein